MKITQGSIIAALALAATSPAAAAPVGFTSPDPEALSPRQVQAAGFNGHRPALRRSTGAPIRVFERSTESMHGLGFEMEERSIDSTSNNLSERDGSLIDPLPVVGPIVGPLLTTVANTVANAPVVGPLVKTVGQTVTGLPIAGPLVKTLGDGLNLGPLVDGPGAPKSLLATNNFAAQDPSQSDAIPGLLGNLPLAGGLLGGLPLGQATSILNGLPLDTLINTAQGAVPLGSLLNTASGLTGNLPLVGGAVGGLTNNLPLVGNNNGQAGSDPLAAVQGITNNLPLIGNGGGDPLAGLQGVLGKDGQTYYPSAALQGLLGGSLGQVGQLQQQVQQAAQPVQDQLGSAIGNTSNQAASQAWSDAQSAQVQAQQAWQAKQAAAWAQQQQLALAQAQQQQQAIAQAQQQARVAAQYAPGVFANHGFKAETSGSASGSMAARPTPTAYAASEPSALASPQSLIGVVPSSAVLVPTSSSIAWAEPIATIHSVVASAPAITFSAATPPVEAPAASTLVPASSAAPSVLPGAPLGRREVVLNAGLAPLRLDVQAGSHYEDDDDTDSCDFVSCEDEESVKSIRKTKRFVSKFTAKMRRFIKGTGRSKDQ